jgi:hypothetical protein
MLPTLEPENNHVTAVLTQQAGADQRQRFAHAGQCAPAERQLQAASQAGREALALLLCDDHVADSQRALPSRASPTAFSRLFLFIAALIYFIIL